MRLEDRGERTAGRKEERESFVSPQIKKYHQKYYITVKHGIVANTKIDWRNYDEVFI